MHASVFCTGHETMSAAINWAIYCLGKYPEIQENIHKEVMQVVGTENVESYVLNFTYVR